MPLPLWCKGLTPELRRVAQETLGETPETRESGIRELRALVEDRDDLHSRTDDVFLLRFLRTKKHDVQKAFRLLLNYHAFRAKQAGSFIGDTPSRLRHVIEMGTLLYSPRRLPSGSHLAVYRMGSFDVSRACARDLVSAVLLVGEMILECEPTQVCGGVFVVDMGGMSAHHYTQFYTLSFVSFLISVVQDCLPERLKAIHFVNEPFIFHTIYSLVKPLLKKKLKERVRFHGRNLESLHASLPKDLLPVHLGGHLTQEDNAEFADYFFSQESYIEGISKYGLVGGKNGK